MTDQEKAIARHLHMKLPMATQEDAIDFASRFLDAIRAESKPVAWMNKNRGTISVWEKKHYIEMKALGSPGGERWLKGEDAERHNIPLYATPTIPPHLALVPREPTEEMCIAGVIGPITYKAMLAAGEVK